MVLSALAQKSIFMQFNKQNLIALLYLSSRKTHWTSVNNCSDLQSGKSCDLTKSLKEMFGLYQARVQAFSQDQESSWTTSKFFTPMLDSKKTLSF